MSGNNFLVRTATFAAAALMALGVGVTAAQAAPSAAGTGEVSVAADCNYVVVATRTSIRSGPGTSYPVVRTKVKGEHLTGPATCVPVNNAWWEVYLSTGGYGYAPKADLRYTG
ncbi:hypothetical protein [Lentzea kentuckyensis]|uniref:hypothetical protein n=1 Tax=Lentzea kentuckyensis TaxID=360086 RepID=UPI000A3C00BB|nr:hypothetical protein [Lentzea kentuckyensis]